MTNPECLLALSARGGLLVIADARGVHLMDPRGAARTTLAVPAWSAVCAFEAEAWVVIGGARGGVHRFARDGQPLGEPLALGLPDAGVRLEAGPCGPPAAVLWTPAPLALQQDGATLVADGFAAAPDLAVPLGPQAWLLLRDGHMLALRAGNLTALAAAPVLAGARILDAGTLCDGAAVALLIDEDGHQSLLVLDARTGEARRRIRVEGARRARIAGRRGHAVVLRGEHELMVVDLSFGKTLCSSDQPVPVLDFAVDAAARTIVVARGGQDDLETLWGDYAELWNPAGLFVHAPPPAPAAEVRPACAAHREPPPPWRADPPVPEPAHDGFDGVPCALSPRDLPPIATGPAALHHLERHLALVSAWVNRAVAEGWDSGRLAFAAPGALPFEHEVAALAGGGGAGRARERLEAALAEARGQEATLEDPLHHESDEALSPLAVMALEYGLSRVATDILLVLAAPRIWGELARLYAIVANDAARPLCDEWLIAVLLGPARAGRRDIAAELEASAPLIRHGLVQLGSGERPFAPLGVHPLVVRRLYGERFDGADSDPAIQPRNPDRGLEELAVAGDLAGLWRLLGASPRAPARVVVKGSPGSGRRTLLAALAARAGRRLGVIELPVLSQDPRQFAEALASALVGVELRGWLPCLAGANHLPAEEPALRNQVREVVRRHLGPVVMCCAREEEPALDPGYLSLSLGLLDETARRTVWSRALVRHGLPADAAEALAARYQIGPAIVERTVVEVASEVATETTEAGAELPRRLDDAVRRHRDGRMGQVARRVTRLATFANVVLPPEVTDSVREFIGRVRHRRTVFEGWGFDDVMSSSRGLTALFSGGPGTGKSMVAGVIARELGLDLYRVDLSRVLSKWVGETERNLAEVFDAAEDGQVILLFDEADALFARRTEVRSSNDRFANMQVNYLLERLDAFQGIAVLTTNFGGSIDPAFRRRLSLRLSFPFPDEEMRAELWRVHLPAKLPIEGPLALDELARKYQLSGGYIRNATLRAAFLAAHEGTHLGQDHLERAVMLEYRETGKLISSGILE